MAVGSPPVEHPAGCLVLPKLPPVGAPSVAVPAYSTATITVAVTGGLSGVWLLLTSCTPKV